MGKSTISMAIFKFANCDEHLEGIGYTHTILQTITLWLFNIAMENHHV